MCRAKSISFEQANRKWRHPTVDRDTAVWACCNVSRWRSVLFWTTLRSIEHLNLIGCFDLYVDNTFVFIQLSLNTDGFP